MCEFFNSDKGENFINQYAQPSKLESKKIIAHGYAKIYEKYLKNNKDRISNIIELGSFYGNASAAFFFYFKNAQIYSADINPDMYLYSSKRLENFFTDTSSRSSIEKNILNKNIKFDLIIEDASHMLKDQIISLFILFKTLKSGGLFIVEEIDFPEKREDMRIDLNTYEVNLENSNKKILEAGLNYESINFSDYEGKSLVEIENKLTDLEAQIIKLGAINLAAPEEIKEESKRKEELDEQYEDLTEALEKLTSAIKKIDQETKTIFKESFDAVNAKLKEMFPKLFGGGMAELILTDENELNAGVVLMARPPGKKNSSISQLSGGEKALTALALVFAIFDLNPAPFCLLDEVDAPLDDLNTLRFVNMVEEMSETVQFIFITHNKVSMERSDHLMGVTMQEAGVSRVVSVDVNQAVEMAQS